MAEVGSPVTQGMPTTLDVTDEYVTIGAGLTASLVTINLQFDGSWSGTLTFRGGMLSNGTMSWDPILATNLTTGVAASTTAGGAGVTENHRIDASGFDAISVYATSVVAGQADVTFRIVIG